MPDPITPPPGGTTTPPPGGTTTPPPGGTTTPPPAPWYGADVDADTKGYIENKGWDSVSSMVKSTRELESFVGIPKEQRLVLPKDPNDKAAMGEIFNRLGRPATPDQYGIKPPDGQPPDFVNAALPVMHELGLTRAQAEGLNKFMGEYQTKALADMNAKAEQAITQEEGALKTEWGRNFDANMSRAQRAAVALGLKVDGPEIDSLETVLGYSATMKLFEKIGAKLGEDTLNIGAPGGGSAPASVEQARARLEQLKGDKDWMSRYFAGGAAEVAEKNKLDAIIAGVPQAA